MPRSYAVGAFADELGVHRETVKRWCRDGDLEYTRTPGGDRRIPERELRRLSGSTRPGDRVALYARVAERGSDAEPATDEASDADTAGTEAPDAEDELGRQLDRLADHAADQGWDVEATYADVGSGSDADRDGLQELLDDVPEASYGRVLVAYDAALTRDGDAFLERYLDCFGVAITALEDAPQPAAPERAAPNAVPAGENPQDVRHGDASHSADAASGPDGKSAADPEDVRAYERAVERLLDAVDSTLESYAEGDYQARVEIDPDDSALDDDVLSIVDRVDRLGRELAATDSTEAENEQRTRDHVARLGRLLDDAGRSVETLSEAVARFEDGVAKDGEALEAADEALTELTASIDAVSAAVAEAETASEQARERAAEGRGAAETTTEELAAAVDATAATEDDLEALRSRVEEIDAVAAAIDDIADETHVLALNAQIEAARADQGAAGFGVVAEEVKSLAADAKENAEEIEGIVDDVQTETERTADGLATVSDRVAAGLDAATDVDESLPAVEDAATDAAAGLDRVADGLEEPDEHAAAAVSALEELSERLDGQSETIDRLGSGTDETAALLADLERLQAELDAASSEARVQRN